MLTARMVTARMLTVVAACGMVVAACSGGDDAPEPGPTSTAAGGLTAPGTSLRIDDAATVAFTAGRRASKLKVVVNGVQRGHVRDLRDFDLNKAARQSGVYYVRAAVRNVGRRDIGGSFVKLYGKVSDTLVVQPVIFGSTFGKCNYQPLPKPFGSGKRTDVCMVMLAPDHGKVSAVEWRFDGAQVDEAPISWELR